VGNQKVFRFTFDISGKEHIESAVLHLEDQRGVVGVPGPASRGMQDPVLDVGNGELVSGFELNRPGTGSHAIQLMEEQPVNLEGLLNEVVTLNAIF